MVKSVCSIKKMREICNEHGFHANKQALEMCLKNEQNLRDALEVLKTDKKHQTLMPHHVSQMYLSKGQSITQV